MHQTLMMALQKIWTGNFTQQWFIFPWFAACSD